ncbi:hypothetical protein PPTG_18652 [Phytophthora nicotianae INRA-310]|uniref:Thioredoxin domain-containing protein n=1 Tax=Phytophthora nicotianae (strain INRA-310) TaxID=761204 RepID=W2PHS9_PHYN3|nr:hypothetical protein PPTG_18652 [Phytophthora nicotianae INRA-310]ETM99569.1 hypothetical protein PPTG_18652 [Phytophthora nicotianae INRA-310]
MGKAKTRYQDLLKRLDEHDVLNELSDQTATALRMPQRFQASMSALHDAYIENSSRFDGILNEIMNGAPVDEDGSSQVGWLKGAQDVLRRWWSHDDQYSIRFRQAIETRQTRLQRHWMDAVEKAASKLGDAILGQRVLQSTADRAAQMQQNVENMVSEAFKRLRMYLADSSDQKLEAKISAIRCIGCQDDCPAVNIKWNKHVEKEPTRQTTGYQLTNGDIRTKVFLLGVMEFEPVCELLKLEAVRACMIVAVLVRKEGKTVVIRYQFPAQVDLLDEVEADQLEVRVFPKECLLCSIRAKDRRMAFTYGTNGGRLGTVFLYRFDESFTHLDRSLCALDANGDLQSFDTRTRQTSKKISLRGHTSNELVLGRAGINGEKRLLVDSISSEDHRKLPSAAIENISIKGLVAVGCVDDVLYVVDPSDRAIYASKLSVTVRSDAYRIQRSGQSKSQDYTRLNQQSGDNTAEHWLRVIFHVFEKFPAQSFIDAAINPNSSCSLDLGIVVDDTSYDNSGLKTICSGYFVMVIRVALLLLSALAACVLADYGPRDAVTILTDKNFEKEVLQSPDYWLVEFYAPWCGHCKQLEPQYKAAAKKLKKHVRIPGFCGIWSA